jgi:hypothetical protein
MAYFVKRAVPKSLPLFKGTFQQSVKWLLKAQKEELLRHHHYEIHGAELKHDKPQFVCDFYADDVGTDLV